jgi:flagellar biosynthesis/type III secretory pathway chaperone
MDGFEALQSAKHESLEVLEKISQSMGDQWRTDPAWAGFLHQVSECRDAHRRNELLLRRQLDAVRGALETLVADAQAEPGLYDHMGQRSARAIRALHSYA